MNGLFHAHSGFRYLVLLVALAHLAVCVMGLVRKTPFSGAGRGLSAAFMGTLHTQVILGVVLLTMFPYYPQLIGHLVMMVLAATLATVMHVMNKRAAQPNWVRPLIGTGGALLLIVGGILAIGRKIIGG